MGVYTQLICDKKKSKEKITRRGGCGVVPTRDKLKFSEGKLLFYTKRKIKKRVLQRGVNAKR